MGPGTKIGSRGQEQGSLRQPENQTGMRQVGLQRPVLPELGCSVGRRWCENSNNQASDPGFCQHFCPPPPVAKGRYGRCVLGDLYLCVSLWVHAYTLMSMCMGTCVYMHALCVFVYM